MSRQNRDWSDAGLKCLNEGMCRVCGRFSFEIAHISGRRFDKDGYVEPIDVVPLCGPFGDPEGCHTRFDNHQLDLVPHLTSPEITRAIGLLGEGNAAIRLRGSRNPEPLPKDEEHGADRGHEGHGVRLSD